MSNMGTNVLRVGLLSPPGRSDVALVVQDSHVASLRTCGTIAH
jgi:hypothetical protein